ncbi:hypothetical protein V6N12_000082 [Hibiscus sabdariffa]|uniref:Uncharacterized protein n=1 Tax=Hibiscus sabdariffa TaxID=183260 RepID=A0ABR2BG86_9ROSI
MFQPKCQGGNQRNEHADESWKEVILVEDYSKQEPSAIGHPKKGVWKIFSKKTLLEASTSKESFMKLFHHPSKRI